MEGGKRKLSCLSDNGRSISESETSIRPFLASELDYKLLASRSGCMNCVDQLGNDYLRFIHRLYIAQRSLPLLRQRFSSCITSLNTKKFYICPQSVFHQFLWIAEKNQRLFPYKKTSRNRPRWPKGFMVG